MSDNSPSEPFYSDDLVTLHLGDCLTVMRDLPDASVDAVVTDPPYGLEFMGKEWDAPWKAAGAVLGHATERGGFQDSPNGGNPYSRSRVEFGRGGEASVGFQEWCLLWVTECLRVLKPGGHLLAFGGTRTWHRLACAVEDAGFEVRDSIAWLYGSGFPKSLDVSKAIDKADGVEGERGPMKRGGERLARLEDGKRDGRGTWGDESGRDPYTYVPGSDQARRWQGWGTALKPAFEPVVVARKPLTGTVAANVLTHGTGALNVDGCRIPASDTFGGGGSTNGSPFAAEYELGTGFREGSPLGRWPANVVLDDSSAAALDKQSGNRPGMRSNRLITGSPGQDGTTTYGVGLGKQGPGEREGNNDDGGASRFFPTFRYEAKAPTIERPRDGEVAHPTVKPLDLMRWLVRLVTPPGGTVLEPFAGSGTTAEACVIEGFRCIAIEREPSYLPLIVGRLTKPIQPDLFGGAA